MKFSPQNLGEGRVFFPHTRFEPEYAPFGGMGETDLRAFVADLWSNCFEAKKAETARLKTCELFYAGFHYKDPWMNRNKPVTNFCSQTVETIHPILTESRPRPEITARGTGVGAAEAARRAQDYAQWIMDASWFDQARSLGVRDKIKYGWNWHMIGFDPASGMPIPLPGSVFDFYPDPTARNEGEMEYFIIGTPVSTSRLCAMFPRASGIMPDNIASPSYDVMVRPYLENDTDSSMPAMIAASLARDSEPAPTTTSSYVTSTGEYIQYGHTTFLLQVFCRDRGRMSVMHGGDLYTPDRDDPQGRPIVTPKYHHVDEPCCPSGWRVINMTAGGVFLEPPGALDTCFGGMPTVIGRNYATTDRFFCKGELDDIIPLQRNYNRTDALLQQSLELAANPPVIADQNAGLNANISFIEAGEIVKKRQGTDVGYLNFTGPAAWHFERLQQILRTIQSVGGNPDAQQGQRPEGIEAAAAIEKLQVAAAVRTRGKVPRQLAEDAHLLTKLMLCDGRKNRQRTFTTRHGQSITVFASDLLAESEIRFAEGTGTVQAREQAKNEAVALYQAGLVDEPFVWDALDLKGKDALARRMALRMQAQMQAQAETANESAGARKGASVGGPKG